ncbi:MAG: hypothetical protein LC776_02430, partial [Acidobacteria bacterium]|nr:hypothetical protein [Acidobacteriota bacterium]
PTLDARTTRTHLTPVIIRPQPDATQPTGDQACPRSGLNAYTEQPVDAPLVDSAPCHIFSLVHVAGGRQYAGGLTRHRPVHAVVSSERALRWNRCERFPVDCRGCRLARQTGRKVRLVPKELGSRVDYGVATGTLRRLYSRPQQTLLPDDDGFL